LFTLGLEVPLTNSVDLILLGISVFSARPVLNPIAAFISPLSNPNKNRPFIFSHLQNANFATPLF